MKAAIRIHVLNGPSKFDEDGSLKTSISLGNMATQASQHLSWEKTATPFISVFSFPEQRLDWPQSQFEDYREHIWKRAKAWMDRMKCDIEFLFIDLSKTQYVTLTLFFFHFRFSSYQSIDT